MYRQHWEAVEGAACSVHWYLICLDGRCPLEYMIKMQTVVETPTFLNAAERIFDEAEMRKIIDTVAADPECGDVMAGTGGFRRFRFAREGMGKRRLCRLRLQERTLPGLSHHGLSKEQEGQSDESRTQRIEETCRQHFRQR